MKVTCFIKGDHTLSMPAACRVESSRLEAASEVVHIDAARLIGAILDQVEIVAKVCGGAES